MKTDKEIHDEKVAWLMEQVINHPEKCHGHLPSDFKLSEKDWDFINKQKQKDEEFFNKLIEEYSNKYIR